MRALRQLHHAAAIIRRKTLSRRTISPVRRVPALRFSAEWRRVPSRRARDGWWLVHVRLNGRPAPAIRCATSSSFAQRWCFWPRARSARPKSFCDRDERLRAAGVDALGHHFPATATSSRSATTRPIASTASDTARIFLPTRPSDRPSRRRSTSAPRWTAAVRRFKRAPSLARSRCRCGSCAPIMARVTHLLADGELSISASAHLARNRHRHQGRPSRRARPHADISRDGAGRRRRRNALEARSRANHVARRRLQKMYKRIAHRLQQLTAAMKGRYVINPSGRAYSAGVS